LVGHNGLKPRCSSLRVPLGLRASLAYCRALSSEFQNDRHTRRSLRATLVIELRSPKRGAGHESLRYDHGGDGTSQPVCKLMDIACRSNCLARKRVFWGSTSHHPGFQPRVVLVLEASGRGEARNPGSWVRPARATTGGLPLPGANVLSLGAALRCEPLVSTWGNVRRNHRGLAHDLEQCGLVRLAAARRSLDFARGRRSTSLRSGDDGPGVRLAAAAQMRVCDTRAK
jgi:hypothetical protein